MSPNNLALVSIVEAKREAWRNVDPENLTIEVDVVVRSKKIHGPIKGSAGSNRSQLGVGVGGLRYGNPPNLVTDPLLKPL